MVGRLVRKLLPAGILAGGLLFGVLVVFARADTPIVDLSEGQEDFRVVGDNALDYLGEMAIGDINGDGISDLIVGASGYRVGSMANAGAVYVIFGSTDLSGTLELGVEAADIVFYGYEAGGTAGHVVASGDLNGDGYADIVIGADRIDNGAFTDAGAIYVVYGPITETTAPISLNDSDWVNLTVYGQAEDDQFGRAVAVGDVNGDDIDDLIGGAYMSDRTSGDDGSGRTYVLYGSRTLSGTINLSTTSASVTIVGTEGSRLGRSLTTGDVDGDGTDDLIIGADLASVGGGTTRPGEVILIYGSDALSSTIDLQVDNITGQGLGLRVHGVNNGDAFGFFVGSGNINGDRHPLTPTIGYDDVLVGAYLGSGRGLGYVLYGGQEITAGITITSGTWTVPIAECTNVATFRAADSDDRLGRSVAGGDLNDDGYDDFVIGASRADPTITRTNAGEAYVFYGGPHLSGTITISPTGNTDLTVLGHRANDEAGRSIAIGDLNGDGVLDLLVGAVLANNDAGEVYVIWGPAATTLSMTTSADVVETGAPITFTVAAVNRYTQTWDVSTNTTTYTVTPAAGGAWNGNVYSTQAIGTWIVTATHRGLDVTTTITVENPTAVTLAAFAATWYDNAVFVTWETAMELDNLGFNLYRSSTAVGPWTRLNATLIPPQHPGEVLGAFYTWRDDSAQSNALNFYRLEDMDTDGTNTFHGPVSVTVPATVPAQTLYRIYLPLALRH